MALTLMLPFVLPEGWLSVQWIVLMLLMWLLVGGLGVSVGLHRHFAHRAFGASRGTRIVMGIAGSMAAQGPVSYWVGIHRRHHTFSDRSGDPHSPQSAANDRGSALAAFIHGHVGWAISHDVPMPRRYGADLIRDPTVRWLDRHYWWMVAAGILVPGVIGIGMQGGLDGFVLGMYWGGLARIAFGHNVIWSINSFCHFMGRRAYDTDDGSRNVWLLSAISFGESWHNNHHQAPARARFAHHWWQLDIGWMLIKVLSALRLATNVKA